MSFLEYNRDSMNYLKSLVINFLVVFFADHILPDIEVTDQTRLPHLGGDLIFSAVLGLLNSLIFPILRMVNSKVSTLKIALIALILNFGAYAVIKLIPVGIQVKSIEGYALAAVIVALGSFLTNFFEMRRHHKPDIPNT